MRAKLTARAGQGIADLSAGTDCGDVAAKDLRLRDRLSAPRTPVMTEQPCREIRIRDSVEGCAGARFAYHPGSGFIHLGPPAEPKARIKARHQAETQAHRRPRRRIDRGDDMELIDLGNGTNKDAIFADFLHKIRERFELQHAAYAGLNPVNQTIHGFVTYSDDWKAHYARHGLDRIDPTLHKAGRSIAPVDWRRLSRDEHYQRVFRDAAEFGIAATGLTIPVRGPFGDTGLLSVTSEASQHEWELLRSKILSELQSVAVHLHDTVMRSDSLSRILRHPNLSKREIEILQWIAAGKSQHDIGTILSISHRTVEVHIKSAREKLCALTTAQAVARAIALGLIFPI